MAKVHNLDEFGRHKAAERYGNHATTKHGRMGMDTGGAASMQQTEMADPANYKMPATPASS